MSLTLSLTLSNRDLKYFRQALRMAREAVKDAEASEIIEATRLVFDEIKRADPLPDFVAKRIPQLETLILMLEDKEWALPRLEREKLLATFVYFGDPEDLIPDDIPVIGYIDDVIMIELVVRELRHALDAYNDFCQFRDNYARQHKTDLTAAVRKQRLRKKREQLHARMKRRLQRDLKGKRPSPLW